jgi:hypothetical protein
MKIIKRAIVDRGWYDIHDMIVLETTSRFWYHIWAYSLVSRDINVVNHIRRFVHRNLNEIY